jgi:negative regulator of flagellin synthesis FlgM
MSGKVTESEHPMTDGIYNNNVRRPAPDTSARSSSGKTKVASSLPSTESAIADAANASVKAKTGGPDQLHLSNVSKRLADEPSFDSVKVASIKQAIQDGQYPLDPRRIAESFHAIEQMIRQ